MHYITWGSDWAEAQDGVGALVGWKSKAYPGVANELSLHFSDLALYGLIAATLALAQSDPVFPLTR
jgi:hypothetical protein